LKELGWQDQFNFEIEQAIAPVATQAEVIKTFATEPSKLIQIVGSGNIPAGLLQEITTAALISAPKSMETSTIEKAAQKILTQHQVRLNSLATLGQNVGDGALVQAVALDLDVLIALSEEAMAEKEKLGSATNKGKRTPFSEFFAMSQEYKDNVIKAWESFAGKSYARIPDKKGDLYATIGYGHRYKVDSPAGAVLEQGITEPQADALLNKDALHLLAYLKEGGKGDYYDKIRNSSFYQKEFDVLIDIMFGFGSITNAWYDIVDAIASNNYEAVPDLLKKKTKDIIGGSLINRRMAQGKWWNDGTYNIKTDFHPSG